MRQNYWLITDLETAADESALPFLDAEPEAKKGLVDPVKIAADIEAKKAAQRSRMSLDPLAGRIVCLGYTVDGITYEARECRDEQDERAAIGEFVAAMGITDLMSRRHLIGFNAIRFDVPWLITRARLLGVPFPVLDTRKYGNRDITDMYSLLTFDGNIPEGAFRRSLQNLARRHGIAVEDDTCGADVAQMVREGDWTGIKAHCLSDLKLTYALAVAASVVAAHQTEVVF